MTSLDRSPRAARRRRHHARAPQACEVLVCHAGTCRRAGAEAVLAGIEELVDASGGSGYCTVRQSGCLGYCSEAPNAVVRRKHSRSGTSVCLISAPQSRTSIEYRVRVILIGFDQ